ncbi:hypothetical protein FKX85_04690 [Echinicola soli]|uniref:Uncharacterized protein n=1 Tax=Echinicola soli TaxID=2591634 RepID=A0A514CEV1_9BACT|nr:DUF6263 family protein [Echinicola soli]QDH78375.1 hypothetical protein FKX85_04690 [Echinicola soli]
MKNLSLLLLICALMASCQSKKVLLRLDLAEGETYYQKSTMASHISQEFGGNNIDIDMNIVGDMSLKVLEVDNESYLMEAKFDKMGMEMKMPMMNMAFSSEDADKEGSNPLSKMFGRMAEKPFRIKMSKKGKILEVTGMEQAFSSAVDEIAGEHEDDQLDKVKSQMKQNFGKNGMLGNLQLTSPVFPENKVEPGDTWDVAITSSMNGVDADHQITYTYVKKEGDQYYLKANGNTKMAQSEKVDPALMPFPMTYDMGGTLNATITLDAKTGWIKTIDLDQTMEGFVEIEKNEQLPDGMSMPMEINMKTKVTD